MACHTAADVAHVLATRWITYYGWLMSIHSDRGLEFDSILMHKLCDLLKIEKTRTCSFHPSSDGMVERHNATMCRMLWSIADERHDWDELLPLVMMAYRATIHSSTSESPNMMLFGRQNSLPIDVLIEDELELKHVRSVDYVNNLEETLRWCHKRVREQIGRAALRQKRYYDRKHHLNAYRRGDLVLKRKKAQLEKFGERWIGPYVVLDKLSDVTYRIQETEQSAPDVVHHDMLKLYYPRTAEENDTSWIDRVISRYNYRRNTVKDKRERLQQEQQTTGKRRNRKNEGRIARRKQKKEHQVKRRTAQQQAGPQTDVIDEGSIQLPELAIDHTDQVSGMLATSAQSSTDSVVDADTQVSKVQRKRVKISAPEAEQEVSTTLKSRNHSKLSSDRTLTGHKAPPNRPFVCTDKDVTLVSKPQRLTRERRRPGRYSQ